MKKGTNDSKTFILKKSNNKGKRFEIIMKDHSHHFASDVGKTFIDHKDKKKKYDLKNKDKIKAYQKDKKKKISMDTAS